jgi:hypothetical protein
LRLGAIEKSILLACLQQRTPEKTHPYKPDLYRDELPGILWGWKGRTRCYSMHRSGRPPQTYVRVNVREYRCKQAALSRALATLYQKGLIDAGKTYEATGLHVYSAKRAAALGIEPKAPLTDEELRRWITPIVGFGMKPWNKKATGTKPRDSRNIKSLTLTSEGYEIAVSLNVNSQERSCDLTRS